LRDDGLDAVDGGGVALRGQTRPGFAMNGFEVVEAVVERAGQVRGGAARLAAPDGAVVEDDHGASLLGEQVRGGEAGDARPHDADVRDEVRGQGRTAGNVGRARPYRKSLSTFRMHIFIVGARKGARWRGGYFFWPLGRCARTCCAVSAGPSISS